jgi:hypothetical protein
MNLVNNCIVCGSAHDLNTKMVVSLNNENHEIVICDEHAEDMTPRQAKELVTNKISDLKKALDVLKQFGMSVGESTNSGIIIAKSEAIPQKAPNQSSGPEEQVKPAPKMNVAYSRDGNISGETSVVKVEQRRLNIPPPKSIGGKATTEQQGDETVDIETHQPLDINQSKDIQQNKLTSKIKEVQTVRGRGGAPITIPKSIRHSFGGETNISIVDTGGDKTLQERFKTVAEQSKSGDKFHMYGRDGYSVIECTLCKGTLKVKNKGETMTCPKCKGAGILNR